MSILIGWAEESLVPEKKVSLAGQFYERISEFVESEISVTAMAVEADGEEMIIVSCDTGEAKDSVVLAAREKFAEMNEEVDPEKIIICATHTHTSLEIGDRGAQFAVSSTARILEEFLPEGRKYIARVQTDETVLSPEEGFELLTDKIALAADRAWKGRSEALYANEFGRAPVGMNRRVCYNDGTAKMWGDTNSANFISLEGGNDSGIELIYTFDKNKKLTGIVANIACPAQILEQRSFISADFWGRAKANLREKFGQDIHLLALCGAAGDQCPRDLVRWVNPETPICDPHVSRPNYIERKADPSMFDISGCNKVGRRISNEIISVFEEITEYKSEAVFRHTVTHMDMPLRKATLGDYEEAVRAIEAYVEKNKDRDFDFEDNAKTYIHTGTIARFRRQQTEEVVPIECHFVRFGDVAFATNPYELYQDYANVMKARSLARQTFIVQLACGSHAYLATKKAEEHGHFSAYIASGDTGYEGGNLLTRKTITEINKLFTE
ncbi:MAG: hypothetical protein IJN74_03280 [Clostridia bacterium]|nr:hypothetical protein [Clostridia bacterium]